MTDLQTPPPSAIDRRPALDRSLALLAVDAPRHALVHAFHGRGLVVVHSMGLGAPLAIELLNGTPDVDVELLAHGGVQTMAPGVAAIGRRATGAFEASSLDGLLRGLGVGPLVVCGSDATGAVVASVREARLRGFEVLVVEDAVAPWDDARRARVESWGAALISTVDVLGRLSGVA